MAAVARSRSAAGTRPARWSPGPSPVTCSPLVGWPSPVRLAAGHVARRRSTRQPRVAVPHPDDPSAAPPSDPPCARLNPWPPSSARCIFAVIAHTMHRAESAAVQEVRVGEVTGIRGRRVITPEGERRRDRAPARRGHHRGGRLTATRRPAPSPWPRTRCCCPGWWTATCTSTSPGAPSGKGSRPRRPPPRRAG